MSLESAADTDVRRTGIGGSDAAAVCGLDPYRTPLDVYLEKRGLVEPGAAGEPAEWGRILEPVLLAQYAMRTGQWTLGRRDGTLRLWSPEGEERTINDTTTWSVPSFNAWLLDTIRHNSFPWMIGHLDAVVFDEGLDHVVGGVEVKTTSAWRHGDWGNEGTDQVPERYLIQIAHYQAILASLLGRQIPFDVPVLIGGQRWRLFHVGPDEELQAQLIAREREFWRRVEEGDPPPASPDARGKALLAKLYPRDTGEERVVPLGDPRHRLAMELKLARGQLASAEKEAIAAEVRIKEVMGTLTRLVGDGWHISWAKTSDRTVVDHEAILHALIASHPELATEAERLAGEHVKLTPGSRRFLAVFKEDKDEQ